MSEAGQQPATAGRPSAGRSLAASLKAAWYLEFSNLWWRLLFSAWLAKMLPEREATGLRTALIRAIGFRIGRGTRFHAMPMIQSTRPGSRKSRLCIGSNCVIGTRVILEFGEVLAIGDRAVLEDGVVILTTTHQLGPKEQRAGPSISTPVTIGSDVRIGENSIILPGVTLGDRVHVLANSVVNASVASGTSVSGIPARPQRGA